MFANTFQSGFISIFYSVGSNPLQLWDKQVKNGHIRRVVDDEVRSLVLEISGTNVATTYITCPIKPRMSLGIKLPFLVMIVKNMKKYFTFEIQILDDKDMHRRFRVSNFQSTTKVRPFCTTMPIGLSSGWNQVQFNLADFTKRAYGSTYLETTRVQIHANVRIRRIYFSDVLYSDEELPNEYKLFLPTPGTQAGPKPGKIEKKAAVPKGKQDKKAAAPEPEPPSAAPPSPEPTVREEAPLTTPEAPSEAPTAVSETVTEPPSEKVEEPPVAPGSEEPTTTTSTAEPEGVKAVEPPAEGEAVKAVPAEDKAVPAEGEAVPAEETAVEQTPPPQSEAAPGEEAPTAEKTPAEVAPPAEKAPTAAEAPPAAETPPAAEAPPAAGASPAAEAPPAAEEAPKEEEAASVQEN